MTWAIRQRQLMTICLVISIFFHFFFDSLDLKGSILSIQTDHQKAKNGQQEAAKTPRYAYAFLMAGCDPTKMGYRGYLYNILIAKFLLSRGGSKADVVVMVRMLAKSTSETLPLEEETMLRDAGIVIMYLPKPKVDNFYSAVMEKFRILTLTSYTRVLFLDSDIIPFCNLDYMFHMSSEGGPFKENVVLAWRNEPAQGGFFLLTPRPKDFDEIERIVATNLERSKSLPWPHFDPVLGWGHVIEPPDYWQTRGHVKGTNWTWYAAFADQGLLYYWTKYVKQSVSIIFQNEVENWSSKVQNGTQHVAFLEEVLPNPLKNDSCISEETFGLFGKNRVKLTAPVSDFHHFVGRSKPWIQSSEEDKTKLINWTDAKTPEHVWFHALRTINDQWNLTIDVENLSLGKPLLGLVPGFRQMVSVQEGTRERSKK